ncbi:TPA: hypothetical protein UOR20_003913 [Escherichia coli]|nr:hypothetical protein [Escherichia coli]ELM8776590.1 hypothetical protein [Escherichia coli]EMA4402802.1 hypothetical protein [Escherichia coli]HAH8500948.1 hypothetical protein [Escherichia coli]HEL5853137.1 hypothetical protein [Escherichia coli]
MCDCMEDIGNKLKQMLMAKVPEGAEIDAIETKWENEVINLSAGKLQVNLVYKLAYRPKKKNGEFFMNRRYLEASIAMAYCPFCGEKRS